ncbi:hypothetical protein ACFE04_030844 [Oxalis oulophora]
MKNLKLYSDSTLNLELPSIKEAVVSSAFDIERNRLLFVSDANFIFTTQISSFHDGGGWSKTALPAEIDILDLEPGDFVTSFHYLMEKEALIVGTSHGLLLLHNVDDKVTEEVGRVEGGVKCISPSPDGDLLGVITGFGQLLVMTYDWDLLYETSLVDDPDVDICDGAIPSEQAFESHISWRGDGKYFATLTDVCGSTSSHDKQIKVWERDSGAVHAVSEPMTLVGTSLEWMPSGAKIAAVRDEKSENKSPSVVFFERNGLERSSFSISEVKNATVELLKWNCHSDLLAAVVRSGKYDFLKIWVFSNNHWYLKHEIRYAREDNVRFLWNPTKPLELICWTRGGQISFFNFIWITAVMDNSTALVIDNSRILVTPLSFSLMPPPMYLFSLNFPCAVRDMAFYNKSSKNLLAVSLADGCLCLVELPALDIWEEFEGKEFCVEPSISEAQFGSVIHLTWLDSHKLLSVCRHGSVYFMQEIDILCSENNVPGSVTCSGWHANISNQFSLEEKVIGLVPNFSENASAYVQCQGGKILEYEAKVSMTKGPVVKQDELSFSVSCPWMSVVSISSIGALNSLLFGLDELGRLHLSGRIIFNNCSSFSFYSKLADQVITHLVLTTKQDLLLIVDIIDIFNGELELKYVNFNHGNNKKRGEEQANVINIWERGAKIAGVLHGDEAAVILQTIRGNLECVYPRKLVLSSIINALDQVRFKDALLMARRQRIDFNVIVDHCGWQAFVLSASLFVKQVNNLKYITEFVCAIKNESIMETLYKNYVTLKKEAVDVQTEENVVGDGSSKVSSVLLAIRKSLEEQVTESSERELCILTTLARSDPPALEEALERIKIIRDLELSGSNGPKRKAYPSAEEALKHLLWLSDSDAVYESALGLYDLNLAAIVALNSQRDPKEFLPFLQELERMPAGIMRYNIDLRLQRFEKALKHIVSAGDAYYSDFINLIMKNPQLFPLGLQLTTGTTKRAQVLEAWGDHLCNEKLFEDAATNYLRSSNLEKALKAYRACGNWTGVLTIAGLLKMSKEEITQLANDLCEELQAMGKPSEAAKIALEYCKDVSNGLSLLISARDWEEALRIALMHSNDDFISEVKSSSLECASSLIGEYKEGLEKVGKYLARYLAVRQRRLLLAAKLQAEERAMSDVDDDAVSEASSNFSGMSAYTTGTRRGSAASTASTTASKARDSRRQRKRGKIRPGSADEEMALVDHLKGMSLTDGAKHELKSLLTCLVMLSEEETAQKLQRTTENFQLSQIGAVKLAEDAMATNSISEHAHTLERYTQKVRAELHNWESFSWRSKVFPSL